MVGQQVKWNFCTPNLKAVISLYFQHISFCTCAWINFYELWWCAAPARLPSFHTCVGANEERLTPKWYKEHGNYLLTHFFYYVNENCRRCHSIVRICVIHMYYEVWLQFCLFGGFFIGIELVLGTRVKSVDVRRKTILTGSGETITYKILLIATGARVLKLILHFSFTFSCFVFTINPNKLSTPVLLCLN